jgi:hypothetical protein
MMMSVLPVLPGFWPVPVLRPVPKYLSKILEKKVQGLELEPEPTSKLELETGFWLELNMGLGSWFHLLVEPESRFLKKGLEPGVNRRLTAGFGS